ncbi:MAG: NAD(P)H-dependent oxidoreductase [Bacteroidales bacterium]|nr:NAD(P)H-dependent oxidoreductase [Bacteroidales bacterium]
MSQTVKDKKNRVLVLVAHPDMKASKMNKLLARVASEVEGVKVMSLSDLPMETEVYREAVAEADTLVFQFPLYWMSAPWVLKQWSDTVFMELCEAGFTPGKRLMTVVTTGAEEPSFRHGEKNLYTMTEYLRPYEGQANFAQMGWVAPLIVYGNPDEAQAEHDLQEGAKAYRQRLEELAR